MERFTQEQRDKLRLIMNDPVLWAKAFVVTNDPATKKLGAWIARDYQEQMLRDRSTNKVYRCGRRIGKCLPGWVEVLDPFSGQLYTVEELYKRGAATVVTMNGDYNLVPRSECPVVSNGVKPVYRVTLEDGNFIDATENHPLLTIGGRWKNISDLSEGNLIAVPRELNFFGNKTLTTQELYAEFSQVKAGKLSPTIFTLNRKQVAEFIHYMYSENGWMSYFDGEIGYFTTSETLIRQLKHLLLRFGIHSRIEESDGNFNLIIFTEKSVCKFFTEIGSFCEININDLLANTVGEYENLNCDICWQKIKSIRFYGYHETYDLSVPETHNFVANDIIVHNTETMCIEALWKVFTNRNFRVLYVAPYEKQVNLFFSRIKEILACSPLLNKEVTRFVSNPFAVELSNNSMILGFTTGASSSQGAASVRGQRGNSLFLDELDYMGEEDYATISMIAAERGDITTVVSSTPTGKRGIFWRMCVDPSLGFKEFYFPSMRNPGWCKQMEEQFRAQLTPSQYEHEVLAEFGTEEAGVFPKDKVDAATMIEWYAYNDLTESQKMMARDKEPLMLNYSSENPAPYNPFTCIGVKFITLKQN